MGDNDNDMDCACDYVVDKGSRRYSRYYDSPDGCDIPTKVAVTTRYGLLTGMLIGSYDVLMYSHAVGLKNIMARYMYHTVPLGLMGATFSVVANGALHVRKEDDVWNYFLGGLACGPILAYYLRSGHGLVAGGVVLGIAGMVKKTAVDADYTLFPLTIAHRRGYVPSAKNDFSLFPDPRIEESLTCGKQNHTV